MLQVRRVHHLSVATIIVLVGLVGLSGIAPVRAAGLTAADPAFSALWQRTDQPVADGQVSRSWLWGPQANSAGIYERYLESPAGERLIQYFDKGRMEITSPSGDAGSPWYVTSGLLDRELISGKIQIGLTRYLDSGAGARIAVAGDPSNSFPTYGDLAARIDCGAPDRTGSAATEALLASGPSSHAEAATDAQSQLVHYVSYTGPNGTPVGYNVPRAFWEFMNQTGASGTTDNQPASPLFDWLFVLGWPLSDPFWTQVTVAGVDQWVLVQPFERRLLTYTPSNPPAWRVEMGNIGLHYQRWRYAQTPATQPTAGSAYLPLAQGDRWTFSTSAGIDERWLFQPPSRSFQGGSLLASRLEEGAYGPQTTYWGVGATGWDLYGYDRFSPIGLLSDTVVYWPPVHYLPGNDPPLGATWSTSTLALSSTGPPRPLTFSFQVVRYERVSTPAGVFSAWRLDLTQTDASDPAHPVQRVSRLWYTPGVGIVQWISNNYAADLQNFALVSQP